MGLEARCQGRYGAHSGEGRLQHEGDKILFRGAFRLDVPVRVLKSATAAGEDLLLTWDKGSASFSLGAEMASKWAHKILNPPSLLDKLGIKEGHRVALQGKFDEAFLADLGRRVQASAVQAGTDYDVVLLLVAKPDELADVPVLIPRLVKAGALWIVYPKGGGTIRESEVRGSGLAAGLVDNKTCAFSTTLTALRFVRPLVSRSAAHA
jgi:hypothetical protein